MTETIEDVAEETPARDDETADEPPVAEREAEEDVAGCSVEGGLVRL